jgi:putative tryptophan/tyrosine transport system substrate-binding protein
MIGRRELITLLGGAAAAWPLVARAQQPRMPVVGYLGATDYRDAGPVVDAFRRGLAEGGFVESGNVAIEFRWAAGYYDHLPALASELVSRHVEVLLAGSLPATLAAKQATTAIPIVFVMGADPVKLGLVASLNRPGGQLTGICQLFGALGGKRLELIRELVPSLGVLAVLSNPDNANAADHLNEIETAARAIGQQLDVLRARNEGELETAFASIAQRKVSAVLVADDALFDVRRDEIVALAARHAVPASYYSREFVVAGGLMSYGSSRRDNQRMAGGYVARVLKGAKPADLPVLQPTTFELVINLKTAKALGLEMPPMLLARADEVIE